MCTCTTAWPRPRAISQRFTGNAATHATPSASASEPQKSGSPSVAAIAPGIDEHDRVVDELHHRDRERVGGEREPAARRNGTPPRTSGTSVSA